MLKNYLLIALRSLKSNKLHTFINLIGLTIGLSCFVIISLWIADEYSFDKSLSNKENIYQLSIIHPTDIKDPNVPYILPSMLASEYSEIQAFTRIIRLSNKMTCTFKFNNTNGDQKQFVEQNVMLVDSSFFSIFSYSLLEGDKNLALARPYSVVLEKKVAERFFDSADVIGKNITLNDKENYIITGIFEQTGKSHLNLDVLLSIPENQYNNWNWADPAYIITKNDISVRDFKAKIANYFNLHQPYKLKGNFTLNIVPLTSSYLSFGRMKYIYIISAIAFLILFNAGINYVNLSTASFTKRTKEMMIRKTSGALKTQLIFQIISESAILSAFAFILSLILVELILPYFNIFFNRNLLLGIPSFKILITFLFPIAIIFGIMTGIYPAIFLSRKNIFDKFQSHSRVSVFRDYAITGQFIISILLIVCSVVIFKQLQFIQHSSLGFDPYHVIKIPINREVGLKFETYRSELLKNNQVKNVTLGQSVPFNEDYKTSGIVWPGKNPDSSPLFRYSITASNYIETFGMEIVEGRSFMEDYTSDQTNYIVNEEAIKHMDLSNPIGEKISFWNDEGEIIGIVKDFHHVSLHKKILPHIISINPKHYNALKYVFIKISSENIAETIDHIKFTTQSLLPNNPFEFGFIENEIGALYEAEQKMASGITYFTFVALLISALGIFGMTIFLAEQKSKEIGIRKINGATTMSIIILFNKRIFKWVLLAGLIACPFAYIISYIWLTSYAYKTPLSWWIIILSTVAVSIITLLSSGYETVKAAGKNPVQSLKYE